MDLTPDDLTSYNKGVVTLYDTIIGSGSRCLTHADTWQWTIVDIQFVKKSIAHGI